jgi:hypothetical protein
MSWTQVEASIEFWDPTKSWGASNQGIGGLDPDTEQQDIVTILHNYYIDSTTFAGILDDLSSSGIKIAKANAGSFTHPGDWYSAWNPSQVVWYFNTEGTLVEGLGGLILAHELIHQQLHQFDFDPDHHSISDQNSSNYDFLGPILTVENQIITELGIADHITTGYSAQFSPAGAATYGFAVDTNYTDGQTIDITRLGDENDNVLDMRNRTDNSRDLIFGDDGNDSIYGGAGDDHLYGGGAADFAGSGNDKLYGGDGGDQLFGGDGNDLLDSGLNVIDPDSDTEREDRLYGGDGNDVLIMRGIWCKADGGDGSDQYWITDSGSGCTYNINDTGVGDSIYWHGYELSGGTKQVIELIYDPTGATGSYADVGALDSNGFRYYLFGDGLSINAPDGSGILIENFEDGDFGIHVGAAVTDDDVTFDWAEVQPNVFELQYHTTLSLSSIANNGQDFDYASLPGAASTLANDGPHALPTTWLP